MAKKIALRCPNLRCRAVLSVPEEKRGECVRCGVCGQTLRVPGPQRVGSRARPAGVR